VIPPVVSPHRITLCCTKLRDSIRGFFTQNSIMLYEAASGWPRGPRVGDPRADRHADRGALRGGLGGARPHCCFREGCTEYASGSGMNQMSGRAQRQCGRALGGARPRCRVAQPLVHFTNRFTNILGASLSDARPCGGTPRCTAWWSTRSAAAAAAPAAGGGVTLMRKCIFHSWFIHAALWWFRISMPILVSTFSWFQLSACGSPSGSPRRYVNRTNRRARK
jgi:hypothetical protein